MLDKMLDAFAPAFTLLSNLLLVNLSIQYMCTGYMRLEMPRTKNKSIDEPRELNFTISCSYFMNI